MHTSAHSSLRLLNDSTQRDTDWWDWSLWIEGSASDLDRVSAVTYKLHPTYPSPVRTVRERASKFRLRGAGWGEFMVGADVRLDDGTTLTLQRWLALAVTDAPAAAPAKRPGAPAAAARRPTLFISANAVDGDFVDELSEALRTQGVDATRAQDLADGGLNMPAAIDAALQDSDGIVAIFSRGKSAWVENELARGLELSKPAFPVVVGNLPAPAMLKDTAHIDLKDPKDVAGLANTIAASLKRQVPDRD